MARPFAGGAADVFVAIARRSRHDDRLRRPELVSPASTTHDEHRKDRRARRHRQRKWTAGHAKRFAEEPSFDRRDSGRHAITRDGDDLAVAHGVEEIEREIARRRRVKSGAYAVV